MNALEERGAKIEALLNKGATLRVGVVDPVEGGIFERIWAVRDDDGKVYCANQPLVFGCWGMLIKVRDGGEYVDEAHIEDQDDEVRADWRALMDARDADPKAEKPVGWWARFLHGPKGDPREDYSLIDENGNDIEKKA